MAKKADKTLARRGHRMKDWTADLEVYSYQPYRKFQSTALLVLLICVVLILTNHLFLWAFWAAVAGAFLAAGILILMQSASWPTIQPSKTITIDREHQIVTFEGFHLKRHDKSNSNETRIQGSPRLAVRFADVRDVYYHRHNPSTSRNRVAHLDQDAVNRHFAGSDNSKRNVTLEVVLLQGALKIPMQGLKGPGLLAQRLSDLASNSPPAKLKTSPVYTREWTLGIGMVVALAVLVVLSWDLKELWWIWLLLMAGGSYRLVLAVIEKKRHDMRR